MSTSVRDRATRVGAAPLGTRLEGAAVGSRKGHLIADIASRLRRVCQDMPDDEFEAMVAEIAAVTLKYERHGLSELLRPPDGDDDRGHER